MYSNCDYDTHMGFNHLEPSLTTIEYNRKGFNHYKTVTIDLLPSGRYVSS